MPDKITYYAIVGGDRTVDNPYGLVRRLEFDGDGFTDESLRKDFSWKFTPLIVEWERGDFEDVLNWAIGTHGKPAFKVSPDAAGLRLVVDIAH